LRANQCEWFYYDVATTSVSAGALVFSLAAVGAARCALGGGSTRREAGGRAPFLAGRGQGAGRVSARRAGTSDPRRRGLPLRRSRGQAAG
jgi:hypothetical protein